MKQSNQEENQLVQQAAWMEEVPKKLASVGSIEEVREIEHAGSTATCTHALKAQRNHYAGSLTTGIQTRRLSARRSQVTRNGRATGVTHSCNAFNKYISD